MLRLYEEHKKANDDIYDDIYNTVLKNKLYCRFAGHGRKEIWMSGPVPEKPYSEEELQEFEKRLDTKLPKALRSYLVNISRELLLNVYPVIFGLSIDEDWKNYMLPMLSYQPITIYENPDDFNDYDGYTEYGLFHVGDGGCAFKTFMGLDGALWASDGEHLSKMSETFEELVLQNHAPKGYWESLCKSL